MVSPDEVHICRDGEQAHMDYADPSHGGMWLKVGPKITRMTDEEIVDLHNEVVRGMEEAREHHDHVAVEIPVGQPQIEYSTAYNQWVPRGHVLRCIIGDRVEEPVERPSPSMTMTSPSSSSVGCWPPMPAGACGSSSCPTTSSTRSP